MSLNSLPKPRRSPPSDARDKSLYQAIRDLTSELSLEVVLQKVADLSRELGKATYSALGVIGKDGHLSQFITSGISSKARGKIGESPRGRGVLGTVLRGGKPIRIADLTKHPDSVGFPPHHPRMKSFLGVSLILKGRVIGDLYLTDKKGAPDFTQEDETLVALFANQAAIAIENARLFRDEQSARIESEAAQQAVFRAEAAEQESQKQLHNVLDNTTAIVYIKDIKGHYIFINHRYEKLFHVSREEIKGKTDHYVFPKEVAEVLRANDRRVLETGTPLEQEEVVPLDDGPHTYISTKHLLYDMKGEPYAVYSISTDITDRKQVEKQMAIAEERERISRDLHDGIIQSIYAVGLNLEDLSEKAPKKPEEANQRVAQAVDDLNQIIRDIRSYIMELRPRELQGRTFDKALQSLVTYLEERTGVTVDLHVEVELVELPERYAVNLWHIFQEAFSNIEKYAHATKVTITLDVTGGKLNLDICDDGIGFELEKAEGGRGYGLSNIKDRSEKLGGILDIDTALGKGTKLLIRIPYYG